MKNSWLLIVTLGLLVNGCATTNNGSTDSTAAAAAEKPLELGMTKEQIIGMYGKTDRIAQGPKGEVWTYHHNAGEQFIPYNFGYRPKITTLTFDAEGKLVDYNQSK